MPRHARPTILDASIPVELDVITDLSTILTHLLTPREQATLHLAIIDRTYHLRALMPGDPERISEMIAQVAALHGRLFMCDCSFAPEDC